MPTETLTRLESTVSQQGPAAAPEDELHERARKLQQLFAIAGELDLRAASLE